MVMTRVVEKLVNERVETALDLDAVNAELALANAEEVIRWAAGRFPGRVIMTSSFGTQAAVMLHLVTRVIPDIPIVFIDTGFHFPETYRFAEEMTRRLNLNLKVYQPEISSARMVALKGQLWDQGVEGMNEYDRIRKVEPMVRALKELAPAAWFAGLRAQQTDFRKTLRKVELDGKRGVYKIHPILDWTGKDVHDYLKKHELPYHPLHEQGYVSIGDWHSTRPITGEDADERSTRFRGLKQECGLHVPQTEEESQSRDASGL